MKQFEFDAIDIARRLTALRVTGVVKKWHTVKLESVSRGNRLVNKGRACSSMVRAEHS